MTTAERKRWRATIERPTARVFTIPTEEPESDGTLTWDSTALVLVEISADETHGLGWTYADPSAATLIRTKLADLVAGLDAADIAGARGAMIREVRNVGRPGIASAAIAAIDIALWDLKAKLLGLSLATLLGQVRDGVPVYGSGGFTSYSIKRLCAQLGRWADDGFRFVKMKVGREPDQDVRRIAAVRETIGLDTALFVDANGAYERKQALAQAERFADQVTWFEEPVSSDDLAGLRLIRDRAPVGMEIAAGEYGYDLPYFRAMLEAGAVDVLQADATRCAGISGLLEVGALCAAFGVPLSAHTAPAVHLHACCALPAIRHLEYFHDHVRIETLLFDGVAVPKHGVLRPDLSRPGLGVEFKHSDAARYESDVFARSAI